MAEQSRKSGTDMDKSKKKIKQDTKQLEEHMKEGKDTLEMAKKEEANFGEETTGFEKELVDERNWLKRVKRGLKQVKNT